MIEFRRGSGMEVRRACLQSRAWTRCAISEGIKPMDQREPGMFFIFPLANGFWDENLNNNRRSRYDITWEAEDCYYCVLDFYNSGCMGRSVINYVVLL